MKEKENSQKLQNQGPNLPREPIDRIIEPITRFLHVEAASGIILLLATIIALILANSQFSDGYIAFWKTKIGFKIGSFEMLHSLKHWISDGLMAIFFFIVGLEVKREMVIGELREIRTAILPIAAAIGGMIVPAAIYLAFQAGEPGEQGWGIPMATDIAFVVGCIAVLGSRIPKILRVLLLSIAIVDDIGAILVIAFGYTDSINTTALFWAFAGLGVVFIFAQIGVRNLFVYIIIGTFVWLGFHESGVHATIAGVILGLMTPAKSYMSIGTLGKLLTSANEVVHGGRWEFEKHRGSQIRFFQRATRETIPPIEFLEEALHPWTSFVIMPLFALANAGVAIQLSGFINPISTAIMAGLVIGKPLGILIFSWIAVRFFIKKLPEGLNWGAMLGAGFLAGIGFTMALFIASLALEGELLDSAKVGIIGGSVIAGIIGVCLLLATLPENPVKNN